MKNPYFILLGFILLFAGCTKNNQNSPANFAYLNVNETYNLQNPANGKNYDIDNDGLVDWGFGSITPSGNYTEIRLFMGFNDYSTAYVAEINAQQESQKKILPVGYVIQNTNFFCSVCDVYPLYHNSNNPLYNINTYLAGYGDFYIGFKSWNPQGTNVNFGWSRLNLSADGKTLIVKDMALNTVNGGSINVGQH